MHNIFTVIRFTYKTKVKSKAFIVSSILLIVIVSVAINLPYILSKVTSHAPTKIGVIQSQSEIPSLLTKYYSSQNQSSVAIVSYRDQKSSSANEQELEKAMAEGKIKGFLEFQNTGGSNFPQVVYKSNQSFFSSQNITSQLQSALQSIKTQVVIRHIGLTPAQISALYAPVSIQPVQISSTGNSTAGKPQSLMIMATALVYALLMLLFMSVTMTGSMIASEVTAEKSSRVMEILISSVSPFRQMLGKIIGVGLVGLSQIVLLGAVAVANLNLPQNVVFLAQFHISLNKVPVYLLLFFVLFYVMGYFLYGTLFAAIGSLVSRTEDLGQAIMPVTLLLLAGFYIGIYGLHAPDSPLIVVASFIPFFTPLIMFLRIGLSNPGTLQIAIAILIELASLYFMTWLSAKIYRAGVLMYGKRPTLRELLKAMRAMKV